MVLLILVSLISACDTKDEYRYIEVQKNDYLVERIYFRTVNQERIITSRVFFTNNNSTPSPSDSLKYIYDEQGNHKNTVQFTYANGEYNKQETVFKNEYKTDCNLLNDIALTKKFLRKELSDPCRITTVILPNGDNVFAKRKIKKTKGKTIQNYQPLNARFRNLSLEVKQFFYGQVLNSLAVHISDGRLLLEVFKFEKGTLKRNYLYEDSQMTVNISATYSNKSEKKIIKKYIMH